MSSAPWAFILAVAALTAQAGYHAGNDADKPPRITVAEFRRCRW
jgi:hypothetical protein